MATTASGDRLFKFQKLSLILSGLLPMNSKPYLPSWSHPFSPVLDNILVIIGLVNLVQTCIMCGITLGIARDAPFDVTIVRIQDFTMCFTSTVYMLKFILIRKNILYVIGLIELDLPSRSAPGIVYVDMDLAVKRSRTFSIIWIAACVLGTAQHALSPLLDGSRALPFQIIYPFDWRKTPAFEIIYFSQFLAAIYVGFIFSAFVAFFVSICRVMTVQYEMLLCSIANIANSAYIRRGDGKSRELLRRSLFKWRNCPATKFVYYESVEKEDSHGMEDDGIPGQGFSKREGLNDGDGDPFEYGEYDRQACAEVIECIKRHTLIMRICNATEDILSFNMLNTIVQLTFMLCLIIFALSLMDEMNNNAFHFVNYLVLGYIELLLLCYYPHLMSHQVGGVKLGIRV